MLGFESLMNKKQPQDVGVLRLFLASIGEIYICTGCTGCTGDSAQGKGILLCISLCNRPVHIGPLHKSGRRAHGYGIMKLFLNQGG